MISHRVGLSPAHKGGDILFDIAEGTAEAENYRELAQHGGPPGWLEESDLAGCDFVCDERSMPPALTDHTTCPGLGLYTKYRHELRQAHSLSLYFTPSTRLFGPQMAFACRLDAISQGPKKYRFPGPSPLPIVLVMGAACIKRGRINHRSINCYF
jgi:hypothetical protein